MREMRLVSDIYQYKVDKSVTCNLQIPVYMEKDTKYEQLVVKQTTEEDNVFDNVKVVKRDKQCFVSYE